MRHQLPYPTNAEEGGLIGNNLGFLMLKGSQYRFTFTHLNSFGYNDTAHFLREKYNRNY